jgi:hypothetical protein
VQKINIINIGLMLLSTMLAFLIPFELFLFVYAVLGPLHYLTEISWLHDRNYFTKHKYDVILLIAMGVLITLTQYNKAFIPYNTYYVWIAFLSALAMVFIKNIWYKLIAILIVIVSSKLSENFMLFLLVFLPTLIHVYIFTGLFILFGSLKSKSASGYLSMLVFILCPILLLYVAPNWRPLNISSYALHVYPQFETMNAFSLKALFGMEVNGGNKFDLIYNSNTGNVLMRFIAFAYTYHYLNWFSKTNIIRWHEVPKKRFAFVIALWIISIALYAYNYKLGFEWLFLLSFLHVVLEFPLNHISITGIGIELINRVGIGKKQIQGSK